MKLFQKLLLAPAALGLLAPMAASAADLNLDGVNKYATEEQVTSVSQFSDVRPTDWAYQALSNLVERYGCVAGYPNGTYKGGQAMTRYEAAALLNACLDRVTEVTDELKRLMKEFEKELAVLKGRVDGLEAKVGELEANQFSTTTKLKGVATFVIGANSFSGDSDLTDVAAGNQGGTNFAYDVRLNFDTSFTGKDLLRTTLRAGNMTGNVWGDGPEAGGSNPNYLSALNDLEVASNQACNNSASEQDCTNVVSINRLFYQFPVGNGFTATVGARVRQDDMLAMWPSVYPADTILDIFTYAGAPGAYNLNLGSGGGLWWQSGGFSISANYVANNGEVSDPDNGGIGTDGSAETGTVQVGYASSKEFFGGSWGIAAAYNYSNGYGVANGTPLAILPNASGGALGFESINSVGVSGYWQPSESGWIPSISLGWGYNSYNEDDAAANFDGAASQSWYVGLQWNDAFIKGNALGMAVGQPTFITNTGDYDDVIGGANDGNYAWEWWYKFQVTDNISVTPAIFYLSSPLGQLGEAGSGSKADLQNFGGLVKTTFRF